MANDPNTYYAKPNETVDGSKLPSNITDIQGAGGNNITLAGNLFTYRSGTGKDNIVGQLNYSQIILGNSSNAVANLQTGLIQNNGFGGSDTITNVNNIWTGGTNSYSATIIGNTLNNQFWLNNDNNTIDGGGGSDEVLMVKKLSTNYSYFFITLPLLPTSPPQQPTLLTYLSWLELVQSFPFWHQGQLNFSQSS